MSLALGVDVDQAHLHGGERVLQLAFTGVAFVAEPRVLGAPIHVLLGLPHIGATAAEAKGLKAHGFERTVAGENHQVGPGDLLAVFLFDRPEQAAGFVEVHVVRPAIQRSETLLAGARAAATVARAVGAGAVPRHADEERPVVTKIGRPPLLRIRHQRVEVLLDRREIELFELGCVVEVRAHRIRERGVLVEHFQVELVGPPLAVGTSAVARRRGLRRRAVEMREGAFAAGAASWVFHSFENADEVGVYR
jgi:hypothetical protein